MMMTEGELKSLYQLAAQDEAYARILEIYANDIGRLCYKGNSVAHWEAKATAYKAGLERAWDALRECGISPDGKMSVADAIRKLANDPR